MSSVVQFSTVASITLGSTPCGSNVSAGDDARGFFVPSLCMILCKFSGSYPLTLSGISASNYHYAIEVVGVTASFSIALQSQAGK